VLRIVYGLVVMCMRVSMLVCVSACCDDEDVDGVGNGCVVGKVDVVVWCQCVWVCSYCIGDGMGRYVDGGGGVDADVGVGIDAIGGVHIDAGARCDAGADVGVAVVYSVAVLTLVLPLVCVC